MKKKLASVLICLAVLFCIPLSARATTTYIHDYAVLCTSTQRMDLESRSKTIRSSYGMDVVILTAPDIYGKSAQSFADNFYDNNGYSADGILFLLDMGGRQWHVSTSGDAINALSDRDLAVIEEKVIPYLSDGRYYEGFLKFYDILPGLLASGSGSALNFGISLLAGMAIAGIAILIMRSGMNTGKPQRSAGTYEDEGSYRLRTHQDLFLYSNVSKTPRPQNNGSSTHGSSSGRSHGGRGGRF